MDRKVYDIKVIKRVSDWALCSGTDVLKDPSGQFEIAHKNESFLIAIAEELQSFGELSFTKKGSIEPYFFSLFTMYSDYLTKDCKEFIVENLHELLFQDMSFITGSNPSVDAAEHNVVFQEQADQIASSLPVLEFLKTFAPMEIEDAYRIAKMNDFDRYGFFCSHDQLIKLAKGTDYESYVVAELDAQRKKNKQYEDYPEEVFGPEMGLIEELRDRNMETLQKTGLYTKLSDFLKNVSREEFAGLYGLLATNGGTDPKNPTLGRYVSISHCSNFLPSLAYAVGHLSKAQYATAALSIRAFRHGVYEEVGRDDYRFQFNERLNEASIVEKFIHLTKSKLTLLVEGGETLFLEFKESLSLDVRRTENDKSYNPIKEDKIETSSLKTLVAFLNTKGGILLVGVSDSKMILGIDNEVEKLHPSLDKFLLYFKDLVAHRLAKSIYANLNVTTSIIDRSTVLQIEVKPSSEPVFLQPGNVFYVRTSASTEQLAGADLWRYQKEHFQ